MSPQRILVTGVTGFLGAHVVDQLVKQGHRVRGTVRSAKYTQYRESFATIYGDNIEIVTVDDLVKGDFTSALQGVDALIHVASPMPGRGDPDYTIDTAVRGTTNVVEQAIKAGIKKISVTGSAVSIADLVNPKSGSGEDDWVPASRELAHSQPTNYMLHYVVSKVLAEKALWNLVDKHTDVSVASVNPPFFIGPFAPGLVIPTGDSSVFSTNLLLFNALIPGSKSQTPPLGFVDVRDVAAGLIAGLNVPGHTRNIIVSPWFDLTEATAYVGETHPELKDELPKLTPTGQRESPFDVEASLKRLGIEVKPWKETVRDAVDDLARIEKEWVSKGVDVNAEGGLRKNRLRDM